jgi:hypothetical protein
VCKGVLMLNPGSPTWPWQFKRLGTVATLTLTATTAVARIIRLADQSVLASIEHQRAVPRANNVIHEPR